MLERTFYTLFTLKITCEVIPSPKIYGIFLDPLENMKLSKVLAAGSDVFIVIDPLGCQGSRQLPFPVGGEVAALQGRSSRQGKVLTGDKGPTRLHMTHLCTYTCPLCLKLKLLLVRPRSPKLDLQAHHKIMPLLFALECVYESSVIWLNSRF